jgi:hypothetical protein
VHGYAIALCEMLGKEQEVRGYVTGIWAAVEGLWSWGAYVELGGDAHYSMWLRVKAAAEHTDGDYSRGRNCRGCYGRDKCPAYLVPPDQAHGSIAKYLTGELTTSSAAELIDMVERVEETVKTARNVLRAFADLYDGIPDGQGKVWRSVKRNNPASFDSKRFELDHPELAQQYIRLGGESFQHRWVNDPAFDEQRKQEARDKAKAKRQAAKEEAP